MPWANFKILQRCKDFGIMLYLWCLWLRARAAYGCFGTASKAATYERVVVKARLQFLSMYLEERVGRLKVSFLFSYLCNRNRLLLKVSEVHYLFSRADKDHVRAGTYWDRFNVSGALVRKTGKIFGSHCLTSATGTGCFRKFRKSIICFRERATVTYMRVIIETDLMFGGPSREKGKKFGSHCLTYATGSGCLRKCRKLIICFCGRA